MEIVNFGQLLEYGAHGLLLAVLLAAWYERREMRKEQFELLKLVMAAHPEAAHVVSSSVKRRMLKRTPLNE